MHSEGADNLTLLGGGTIDGNGEGWWKCGCEGGDPAEAPCLGHDRPRLVNLVHGTGLVIRDLTFTNSPMWTLRPSWFDDVYITNVSVLAPISDPNTRGCNTDGIGVCVRARSVCVCVDARAVRRCVCVCVCVVRVACFRRPRLRPEHARDRLVRAERDMHSPCDKCVSPCARRYVSVGDDAIAVKSGLDWFGRTYGRPSRNITFRGLRVGTGHGISIGSEMLGGVSDVLFENILCNGTEAGPRIKSMRGRGGYVRNVTYRNITVAGAKDAILLTEYYGAAPPANATGTPLFDNVTYEGLRVLGASDRRGATTFDGLPESVITGVVLRDVDLGDAAVPFGVCNYTQGVCVGSVLPSCPPCLTPS